jgi:hypothetical protein
VKPALNDTATNLENFFQKQINRKMNKKSNGINSYCVSRPKSASFSFESEFSGRGAAELEKYTLHFLGDRKQKTSFEKLQIYVYLPFSNR